MGENQKWRRVGQNTKKTKEQVYKTTDKIYIPDP